ncbi:MAG: META domain-containing protein [Synergistaceae bacterium]|nr:META domain-containing protein [Synergistaceae bacterium]
MKRMYWAFFAGIAVILALGPAGAAGAVPTDTLTAEVNGKSYVLERTIAASGEKYEMTGDPSTYFWSKGDDAVFRVKGISYFRYVLIRETVNDDEIMLTADGKNYLLKRAEAEAGARYEYTSDPKTFLWCRSDETMLVISGADYVGYDMLTPVVGEIWISNLTIPTGVEWKVTAIGDEKILDGSSVTMLFQSGGRVSGMASVNGYTAAWIASDGKLLITDGASTKKAGPEPLMEQEDKFLKLLPKINSFIVREGGLSLITRDGLEIVLSK